MENMTADLSVLVIFGLGLTMASAFRTLARLDLPSLNAVPRAEAVEAIKEEAGSVLIEGCGETFAACCEIQGIPLPEGPAPIVDVMENAGYGYEEILACYNDIIAYGVRSGTFTFFLDVLQVMQEQQEMLALGLF